MGDLIFAECAKIHLKQSVREEEKEKAGSAVKVCFMIDDPD